MALPTFTAREMHSYIDDETASICAEQSFSFGPFSRLVVRYDGWSYAVTMYSCSSAFNEKLRQWMRKRDPYQWRAVWLEMGRLIRLPWYHSRLNTSQNGVQMNVGFQSDLRPPASHEMRIHLSMAGFTSFIHAILPEYFVQHARTMSTGLPATGSHHHESGSIKLLRWHLTQRAVYLIYKGEGVIEARLSGIRATPLQMHFVPFHRKRLNALEASLCADELSVARMSIERNEVQLSDLQSGSRRVKPGEDIEGVGIRFSP